MIRLLSALLVFAAVCASAQSPNVVSVDTVDQLRSLVPARGRVAAASGLHNVGDWGDGITLLYRYVADSSATTNDYCIPAVGGGRWMSSAPSSSGGGDTFETLAGARAASDLQVGQIVRVLRYSAAVPYPQGRDFEVTSSAPDGTNYWSTYSAAGGKFLDAVTKEIASHHASWWGITGDGISDNAGPLQSLLAYTTNRTVGVEFEPGTYLTSVPLAWLGNHPINWYSTAGSFETGWNPTNETTAAKLVYTGPSTNIFADLTPAVGLRYGVRLGGLTFDGNGLAKIGLKVRNVTRGSVDFVRVRNVSDIAVLVDNTVYLGFKQLSISANEVPFIVNPAVGLLLTNSANANTFDRPTISGTTNWAVEIALNSEENTIRNAGIESNLGGGIHYAASANHNYLLGSWFENNTRTNEYLVIDSGAFHNVIEASKCESGNGWFQINGGHNRLLASTLGGLNFGSTAGANRAEEVLVPTSGHLTGNLGDQVLVTVKDYAATWYTNNFPANLASRGEVFDLYNGTNAYPMARIGRSSILFGDGTTGLPDVGIERYSALSLALRKSVVHLRDGASDGLYSAYVTGDSYPRVSYGLPAFLAFGAGGTNPPDVTLSRFAANTLLSDSGILTVRTSTSSTLIGGYTTGSAQPSFFATIGGVLSWGRGGTDPTDVSISSPSSNTLAIDKDLKVSGTLSAGALDGTNGLRLRNLTPSRFLVVDANGNVTNDVPEVGTGAPVRATAPTFSTSITGPNFYVAANQAKIANGSVGAGTRNFAFAGTATGNDSAAILSGSTTAGKTNAIALGFGATGTADNQITLGTSAVDVVIPGTATLGGQRVVASLVSPVGPGDWYPPAANYPTLTTTNGSPVGIFSDSTTQTIEFNRVLPINLTAVPSQLTLVTRWRPMVGNTNSQNIIVGAKVQAIKDADSFNTAVLVTNTVSGTTWKSFTNVITSLTGLALGDEFTVAVYADNAGSATNNYQMSLSALLVYR